MHVDKATDILRRLATAQRAALIVVVGLLLSLTGGSARTVYASMPSAPVEMTLESTGDVAVDVDLTVTLTVRPLVDAERMSLAITLPEGVDLVDGETSWAGPVRARENRVLTVTVRPRRAAFSVIQGAARIEFPDGTILGDVRSLDLPLGERSKPMLGVSPSKKTTTGESVIEFRDVP